MKALTLGIIAAIATSACFSQTDTTSTGNVPISQTKTVENTPPDTTRIELGNSYITIVKRVGDSAEKVETNSDKQRKRQLTWWNGIDVGVNGIMSDQYRTELPDELSFMEPAYGMSRYISFNFGQMKARIVGDYVGFTTGFGVQFYGFKYTGENSLRFTPDSLTFESSGDRNVTKSKLRATYFVIPALLEFNTSDNPKNAWHLSAGIVGKFRLENMYKEKYSTDGNRNKQSIKGALGFNTWQADAMVKVGYRGFSLFTQVGLIPIFESKNAAVNNPDLYSFVVGASFSFN